jgi:hypothetical protein
MIRKLEIKESVSSCFPVSGNSRCVARDEMTKNSTGKLGASSSSEIEKSNKQNQEEECYVETVAEAEQLEFRRAYRWKGDGVE